MIRQRKIFILKKKLPHCIFFLVFHIVNFIILNIKIHFKLIINFLYTILLFYYFFTIIIIFNRKWLAILIYISICFNLKRNFLFKISSSNNMLNSIFVKSFEKYFSMLSMLSIIYLNETFYINKYKKNHTHLKVVLMIH